MSNDLFEAAKAVRKRAYAPYSKFAVGAALRTPSGAIHAGANVENASYPEGCCAETSAISQMIAAGETKIAEVLVIADRDPPITPCGGCRQRLAEFGSADTPVHAADLSGVRRTFTLSELLPAAFDLSEEKR
ncbi:MAG: cytidine deaminase [Hyphomicrobiales bacterium]|nr:MAG: cytidine deaminase [Hyphomicrobiales bacterium]